MTSHKLYISTLSRVSHHCPVHLHHHHPRTHSPLTPAQGQPHVQHQIISHAKDNSWLHGRRTCCTVAHCTCVQGRAARATAQYIYEKTQVHARMSPQLTPGEGSLELAALLLPSPLVAALTAFTSPVDRAAASATDVLLCSAAAASSAAESSQAPSPSMPCAASSSRVSQGACSKQQDVQDML